MKSNECSEKCFNYFCSGVPAHAVLKSTMLPEMYKPGEEKWEYIETVYLCEKCYFAKKLNDFLSINKRESI